MYDFDFIFEHLGYDSDVDLLNELYVGETKFIDKLIDAVSKARAPYVGKMKKPINGNKDFIEIGDMIAKEFGFYAVTFMVPFDVSMNAFTYPITMAIDASTTGVKPKFVKDRGMKYDESIHKLCILVAVTAGVWYNEKISDREVVAAILHEIGHSFVLQSERMIDIIEANRLSIAFSVIYKTIIDVVVSLSMPAYGAVTIPKDIKLIINASNKGKEILNKTHRELANHPLFSGVLSVSEYLLNTALNVFKNIAMVFGDAVKLMAIPFAVLNKILEPLSKQTNAIGRSQEYMSDSFATMYGLGPEIGSFLMKIGIDAGSSGLIVDKALNKIPIIGALRETLNIPILLLSNTLNTHPSTPARINKILDELNKELKDSDLSPKTKEAIKKNIKDLEKIKDEYTTVQKSKKYNAEMVKRMWFSFLINKGEKGNDYEDYYTDLKVRDDYVKKESSDYNIEIK